MAPNYIDLTHVLNEDSPMYPGPGLVPPKIKNISTVTSRGCMISSVSFISHTGTHMDAPCHFIKEGQSIDAIAIERLIANPIIIKLAPKERNIKIEDIMPYSNRINDKTVLIIDTGIDKKYGTKEYFNDFPTLTKEAASWIAERGPAIVATDAPSVDPVIAKDKYIHQILLDMNIIIVECITNISLIRENEHICIFMPLKIEGIDGSPCRAIAISRKILKKYYC
jgi:arylformamidase